MNRDQLSRGTTARDEQTVREYLAGWGEATWAKPTNDEYVTSVVARMSTLRFEHPGGDYPSPTHGRDDIGACAECDALRCLDLVEEATDA